MTVTEEILEFAGGLEPWQQDLLRRVCTQDSLSETDWQESLMQLKSRFGVANATFQPVPATKDHFASRPQGQHLPTRIASIADVRNANRLAGGQVLGFERNGLTINFGYNGSGKTGYARILKQICRCRRERYELILNDVYSKNADKAPAQAMVHYECDGMDKDFAWYDGTACPEELSRISVFDAHSAPIYADKENEIAFLPMGLDIFPRLGKAFEQLGKLLDDEISQQFKLLEIKLPQIESETEIGKLVSRLDPSTSPTQVPTFPELERIGKWEPGDEQTIALIEKRLGELSQPAAQAAICRKLNSSLRTLVEQLGSPLLLISEEGFERFSNLSIKAKQARDAAVNAAKERFPNEPLGAHVGGETWRSLFLAAEQFSGVAYPDSSFPALGPDRVCVLCQQNYDSAAEDRLLRFKKFMDDRLQEAAASLEKQLRVETAALSGARIPSEKEVEAFTSELRSNRPDLHATLQSIVAGCAVCRDRLKYCQKASQTQNELNVAKGFSCLVITEIEGLIDKLDREAKDWEKQSSNSVEISQLKAKHAELTARKRFSLSIDSFKARLSALNATRQLKLCKAACDTRQISLKGTELRKKYLTKEFFEKVKTELEQLNLGYLPIAVEGRTDHGTSLIGVTLQKTQVANNSAILSEGEFRGLALACFLAEIAQIPNHDGIVVDDPVSSLDQDHIRGVAERLVQEASAGRQVVIFTHDLSFYYDLLDFAAIHQVLVKQNWIRKTSEFGFGTVFENDSPWHVKKVGERIESLKKDLGQISEGIDPHSAEYGWRVKKFYGDMRETWERLVEEMLFADVVGRFQPQVMTLRLKAASVEDEDFQAVYFAMARASTYSGHDQTKHLNSSIPSKKELSKDLAKLTEYYSKLKSRKKQLETDRGKLIEPPESHPKV